jgi:hypothetical protein
MRPSPPRKRLPSKDPIDAKANAWRKPAKKRASADAVMAAPLLRLAHRLGTSPEALARTIPKDTIRRLKYPVLEFDEGDGKVRYEHDLGIRDV